MQDDCLDISNKPFYKRWKQLIPPPRGASFYRVKESIVRQYLYYETAFYASVRMRKRGIR